MTQEGEGSNSLNYLQKALLLHLTLSTGVGYPGFQSTVEKEGVCHFQFAFATGEESKEE
jgi:hypothetical protein